MGYTIWLTSRLIIYSIRGEGRGGRGPFGAKALFSLRRPFAKFDNTYVVNDAIIIRSGHAVSVTSYNYGLYIYKYNTWRAHSQFEIDPKVTRKTVILHINL